EPWTTIAETYNIGDEVQGKITKLSSFGAFARVQDGIEGLIHISELSDEHVTHPKHVVKEGDVLTLKVIRVEPERHRLGLSLRQATQPESTEEEPTETPLAEEAADESEGATLAEEGQGESSTEQNSEQPEA
ncbi:MAG: S1 RNA-binding domain-containing protein, partial [Thermoleophilia bacterium]